MEKRLVVGQVWKYNNRQKDENSFAIILKIEEYPQVTIVHIGANNISFRGSAPEKTLGHAPFAEEFVLNSLTELVSENNELPDYTEGYNIWKEAFDKSEAGYWTISIADAIDAMDQV